MADLCYLEYGRVTPAYPVGYAADAIGTEALLTRMSVKEGRLVLPDGMSYAALVLPNRTTMPPQIARKIRQLVNDGATVIGTRPRSSPSLENYPACDAEVAAIAEELWGSVTADGGAHAFGQGRVFNFAPSGPGPAETDRIAGKEQVPAILALRAESVAGCATAGEAGGAGGVYVCQRRAGDVDSPARGGCGTLFCVESDGRARSGGRHVSRGGKSAGVVASDTGLIEQCVARRAIRN